MLYYVFTKKGKCVAMTDSLAIARKKLKKDYYIVEKKVDKY